MKRFSRYIKLYESSGAFIKDVRYGIHHYDPTTNEYVVYHYKYNKKTNQWYSDEELRISKLLENEKYETGDINT